MLRTEDAICLGEERAWNCKYLTLNQFVKLDILQTVFGESILNFDQINLVNQNFIKMTK